MLAKDGVLLWIDSCDRLREERESQRAKENIVSLTQSMAVAKKFADRWRNRALAARARRTGEEAKSINHGNPVICIHTFGSLQHSKNSLFTPSAKSGCLGLQS
ncbi:hypothetical protein HDU67_009788 [Dinochytrium kinnereticum]|nr:hypothetical protein HDU67_009788 [Dinochytrium kinnereticum]